MMKRLISPKTNWQLDKTEMIYTIKLLDGAKVIPSIIKSFSFLTKLSLNIYILLYIRKDYTC